MSTRGRIHRTWSPLEIFHRGGPGTRPWTTTSSSSSSFSDVEAGAAASAGAPTDKAISNRRQYIADGRTDWGPVRPAMLRGLLRGEAVQPALRSILQQPQRSIRRLFHVPDPEA